MPAITLIEQRAQGCSDLDPTTTENLPLQQSKYPRLIHVQDYAAGQLNTCKWAKTRIRQNKATGKYSIIGITCKRWSCPDCAREKTRDLANWTKLASPNKLLTLTVNPACHDNPELAWIKTAPLVPELIRALRKRFGSIEYLRVCEQTEKGWPHYHCMLRSAYLPQPVIKSIWRALTGAEIVDIREVNQFFNSFQYLVKYLTKLRRIEWTDRHVTYSRRFFPVPITKTTEPSEFRDIQAVDQNPLDYLQEFYEGHVLVQTAPYAYELPQKPSYWLPKAQLPPPPRTINQKLLLQFNNNDDL